MGNELSTQHAGNQFLTNAMTTADIVGQVRLVQDVMKSVMKVDEHYGVIPGCVKPSLLKPGAEKLCLLFRLDPQFESTERWDGNHLTVKSRCVLFHIPTSQRMGSGEGSCSSKEEKYAFRSAKRKCPKCGKETITKGKKEYGGGWICFAKIGGCGAKFLDGDKEIEGQEVGKVPNDNLADTYNTILKIANKRSLVAATLVVTAASDIFTQDVEDMPTVVIDTEYKVKHEESKPAPVVVNPPAPPTPAPVVVAPKPAQTPKEEPKKVDPKELESSVYVVETVSKNGKQDKKGSTYWGILLKAPGSTEEGQWANTYHEQHYEVAKAAKKSGKRFLCSYAISGTPDGKQFWWLEEMVEVNDV